MSELATVFMFCGQGSQYFQMGRELFDQNAVFRGSMLHLDEIVRELSGHSAIETVYSAGHGKAEVFDRTLRTHPAIFMVQYSLAQSLLQAGIVPDLVLGASLGSFAAATVAGFVDVEDALRTVIRQAATFEACCGPGGMLAVLGDPALCSEQFLAGNSELAAVNFPLHFVVSARRGCLVDIEQGLKERDVAYQRLPVSFAFHSQWIDEARAPLQSLQRSVRHRTGSLPLMCCEQAAILTDLPEDYFWRVTRHPIRFSTALAQLERLGAHRYIDVGPAGTLATFVKYGLPSTSSSTIHSILTPYGRDLHNFAALTAGRP
jgi:bacillaene synthase trans-acting acyltransferase